MSIVHDTQPLVRLREVSKKFVIHKDKSLKDRILYWGSRSKSRTEFLALDGVTLDIALGETVGLIGHNGSGKSTLLKVIGGIIEASSGEVYRRGRVAALLELGAGFHPDLSGRDNVYLNAAILGMTTAQTDAVFNEIVDFSGIGEFIDSQVKFYSSGMYVRLAFAVAVHSDPDLLLVDEVLAVGDEPFQLKCMNKIRQFQKEGRTIVLVSHSAEQVADVCTRSVVLDGGVVVHNGDVGAGIRILREGYERDRVQRDSAETEVHGTSVDVLGVTVTMPDGTPLGSAPLVRGVDLSLVIHAQVHRRVDWVTGFTLQTPLGQAIYRLNSEGMKLNLPPEPGRYDVRFDLPSVNFGVKRLVISAGATRTDGEPLALLDPAGFLDFEDDPVGAGMVQFDARGSIESVIHP